MSGPPLNRANVYAALNLVRDEGIAEPMELCVSDARLLRDCLQFIQQLVVKLAVMRRRKNEGLIRPSQFLKVGLIALSSGL
jgi:hypothetical protein